MDLVGGKKTTHCHHRNGPESIGKHVNAVWPALKPCANRGSVMHRTFACSVQEKPPRPEVGNFPAFPIRNVTCALALAGKATELHNLIFYNRRDWPKAGSPHWEEAEYGCRAVAEVAASGSGQAELPTSSCVFSPSSDPLGCSSLLSHSHTECRSFSFSPGRQSPDLPFLTDTPRMPSDAASGNGLSHGPSKSTKRTHLRQWQTPQSCTRHQSRRSDHLGET